MTQRSRGWCLTLNNYNEEEYEYLKNGLHTTQLEKWIFGKEVGENKKTKHIQGFIYFKNGKTLSAVKKICGKAHWEASKGNNDQNYTYCSKEGNFECYGWNKPEIKTKYGGYETLEEQMSATPLNCEYKQWNEDEAVLKFKQKERDLELAEDYDKYNEENWSTEASDGEE